MKHITFLIFLIISTLSSAQIISQYVETESGTSPKGLEIWNNTSNPIDFAVDNLTIEKGTNGATPSTDFVIDSGVLQPDEVLVVGTIDMQAAAISNEVLFFEKAFSFNGDDALVLKLGSIITDVFGTQDTDPGSSWEANGVDTRNQNIGLLGSILTGDLVGFTDPSLRFVTYSASPSSANGLDGFGQKPNAVTLTLDNAGASAYFVTAQSEVVTTMNTNNSEWNLEIDKRYFIDVVNPGPHPLMVRDQASQLLLGMSASDGSYATDTEVNFVTDVTTGQFDFTLTAALAQDINNYACQIHTANMTGLINVANNNFDLEVTEIFPGQIGPDLTVDWFEIKNNGTVAWVSGVDADLYYDDESADATTADLIQGLTDIQPGESVVVLVTDNPADITTFQNVWGAVLDLSNLEIGFSDGAGLGGGGNGDAVSLWLGDPLSSSPFETATYPENSANDGQSYDVNLGQFSVVGNSNGAVETIALGGNIASVPNIGSPGDALPRNQVQLAFTTDLLSVNENGGSVIVEVSPSVAPSNSSSVDVSIMMGGTAVEGTHFTFTTTTLNFSSGSDVPQTLNIPIIDNATDDSSVFFVLELINPVGANLGNAVLPVYILDNDNAVPQTDESVLDMNYLTSYTVDPSGTAEILKFDATTQRLYVVNDTKIEILDFSDPFATSSIGTIDITAFGASAQSVDVKNGLVAIAVSANVETDLGSVVFTDIDGNNAVQVQVGALPDMLTFTPDGNSVLVANEGQPSQDYTIDPEGSVSVIDVTGGLTSISQANVTEINFNAFDSQQATLVANDVRIFGPGASVSQDLEPEFITVSEDSQTAYVACQENNAYAIIDLTTNTVTDIKSFGLKDHSLPENTLDVSDETNFIFDASWPIKGMYMPDGISNYTVGGVNYLVTANEGDAREYNAFEEERKIDDADYNLDPAVFQNIDILELESNLSEINVTNASGDANGDGLFEEIHVFGGRSFSIFNADTGVLVYDSGNDFAHITAADPTYGAIFNASNSNNSFKNRSDNKGSEPENVIIQEINGNFYAFVILERIGGVMAYDVSNPSTPVFLEYENSRDATPDGQESGDLGPEGIVYIAPEDSGTGKGLIVLSNEVSATLSVFELTNITLSNQDFEFDDLSFKVYPNPVESILNINEIGEYSIYNLKGQKLLEVKNTSEINVQNLSRGIYIIKNKQGNNLKFIKK